MSECPDCGWLRHELAQTRSAFLAQENTLLKMQAVIERLQAANEAADHHPTGYMSGRQYPDLAPVTSRTGDVYSAARAAAEHQAPD